MNQLLFVILPRYAIETRLAETNIFFMKGKMPFAIFISCSSLVHGLDKLRTLSYGWANRNLHLALLERLSMPSVQLHFEFARHAKDTTTQQYVLICFLVHWC